MEAINVCACVCVCEFENLIKTYQHELLLIIDRKINDPKNDTWSKRTH